MKTLLLPPQGALATEEAVIASRIDIGLESRIFALCLRRKRRSGSNDVPFLLSSVSVVQCSNS